MADFETYTLRALSVIMIAAIVALLIGAGMAGWQKLQESSAGCQKQSQIAK